jgi:hypothetical protein
MVKCPGCQEEHPKNAIFCDKCGYYLPEISPKEANPMAAAEVAWMEREETSRAPGEEIISPLGLKLTMPDSGREVKVPLKEEVSIGRLDPDSGYFPDVDLTSDSGLEKGVSRRHAKITRQGNEVFVEDLGSINGTFLNRRKLIPYLPQALKSGDELQLGQLKLRVGIK